MKGQGTKSKISAVATGVLEFAKTSYYDQDHINHQPLWISLSDIGIKQSKSEQIFTIKI